jgi:hypothetical protein
MANSPRPSGPSTRARMIEERSARAMITTRADKVVAMFETRLISSVQPIEDVLLVKLNVIRKFRSSFATRIPLNHCSQPNIRYAILANLFIDRESGNTVGLK